MAAGGLGAASSGAGVGAIGGNAGSSSIGGVIKGYTRHGLNQAISRPGGGVHPRGILDAARDPKSVKLQGDGTMKYKGKNATIIVDQDGLIITTYGKPRRPK